MEKKYIIPFIKTTQQVFKEFLNLDVNYSTPELFDKTNSKINWDISGIIGLAGDIKGMIALVFSKKLSIKIASNLLGKEISEIDEDVLDIIGEIINIIAGNAKKYLDEYKIFISLPSVIEGKHYSFFPVSTRVLIFKIPFKSSIGDFNLLLYLESV